MTPARLRPAAELDLVERTRFYRSEAGAEVAERFFDTALDTLGTIEQVPAMGSGRLGEICDIPGLRSLRIPGFPCGWFHLERADYVDVVRLLSFAQDLPAALSDIEGS